MERNAPLTIRVVGVVVMALVVAAVVPGVTAGPTDDGPVHPGLVGVVNVSIAVGRATGETITPRAETRISHQGNPT